MNGEYDFNIEYTGNVFAVDSENALKVKAVKVGTATLKIAATYNTVEVKTADMIVTVKDKIEIAFAENTAIRLSLEEVIYNDDFAATATAPTAAVKINGQASDGATIETFGYDKNMTYGGRTFYTDIFTTSYVSDAIGGKTPTGGFLKYTFGKQNNGNMGWGTNWLRLVIALKPSECGENSAMVNFLTALKKAGYTKVSFNLYFAVQADIVLKANTGTFVSNNKLGVAYNCGTQQGRVDISINEWSAFSVDIDHVIGNVTNKNVNSVYAVTAIEMLYGFEFFDATDKVDLYFGDIVAVKE